MEIRDLRPDEIDVRVARVKEGSGVQLLLYKDARCDMNILDETFGPTNWRRDHKEIKNVVYCGVGIRAKALDPSGNYLNTDWVWKWDAGAESATEKEKGEASDSFKRACVNHGIGRELYTAPFIWIPAAKCDIRNVNGKPRCYDNFHVWKIETESGKITKLAIYREKDNEIVYKFGI